MVKDRKTVREFLKEEGALGKFKTGYLKHRIDEYKDVSPERYLSEHKHMYSVLGTPFYWGFTPEGSDWWFALSKQWMRLLDSE